MKKDRPQNVLAIFSNQQAASFHTLETCCKFALLVIILISGLGTALVTASIGMPEPPGSLRMDYHFEIDVMTIILNFGLPLAFLTTAVLTWSTVQSKVFHTFLGALVFVALIGVFSCTLAAWISLVAIHGKSANLWSHIWWSWR